MGSCDVIRLEARWSHDRASGEFLPSEITCECSSDRQTVLAAGLAEFKLFMSFAGIVYFAQNFLSTCYGTGRTRRRFVHGDAF